MNRRDFLAKAGLVATWAGVSITVGACSSDGDGVLNPPEGDVDGAIAANHGHTVVVTEAEIQAGEAVRLTLTEGSSHTHSLDLSAEQVMNIGAGRQVIAESNTDFLHTHTVTFN